ncbi:hypothetical protein ACFFSW_13865 [Saccharothrix longispora]|uniref:Uncharacterized protein YukE n=1 Tax=Saccharothrix longispora TaxID=33920 RepID=A0ABU1PYN0_9PSEU|nr:hypothetical protein [Saccharothrix longispora]MDR6595741.1 uncharacterized protein YukE [Saccharothrix longispora]
MAQAPAEPGGFVNAGTGDNGWATGISIAESAMDTFNGVKGGDWVGAGLGMVGLAADAAAMAIDPFGTLMSSAAAFLMEHVQPLKDMLDWLAGNPPVIESYSTTWTNVATELGAIAEDYASAVSTGLAGWTGAAAEAYAENSKVHGDALSGAASAAGTVGTVVGMMGMVVAFVREVVRDLIADLVGKLIAWVLEAAFTLGFGTPVIVAQAVTAISRWAAKIAKIVQDLLDAIKRVSPLLKRLVEIFEKIMKVVGKLAGKATGLDVLDPKNIKRGGFLQTGRTDVDTPNGTPGGTPGSTSDGAPGGTPGGGDLGTGRDGGTSDPGTPTSRPGDTTTTSGTPTATDAPRPGRDPDGPPSAPRPGRTPDGPDNDLPRGGAPVPGTPGPGNPRGGTMPLGEHRGGPGSQYPPGGGTPGGGTPGSTPLGEHRGGPGGQPAPGTHTPAGNTPGGYHNGGTPGGASPSGGAPTGGAPSAPAPSRYDHTSTSTAATPEAPPRHNQPTTPGNHPNPPGGAGGGMPGNGMPGGAPGGAPGGGNPGGAPGGGAPGGGARPGSGGGWTGTPGGRGDLASGVPAARGPEVPRPSSLGPSHAGPGHTGPSHTGPSHVAPSHNGPGYHSPGPTGPGSTGPGNFGPGHANPGHSRPGGTGPTHPGPGTPPHGRPGGGAGPTPPAAGHHGPPVRPDAPHAPDGARPRAAEPWTPPRRDPDPTPGTGRHHDGADPGRSGGRADNDHPNTDRPDGNRSDTDRPDGNRADSDRADSDRADSDRADSDRPGSDQPSIDEAHARHGETTPAGISHHRGDSDMGDLPHRVPPDPHRFTADVHITPDGRARIGNHTYTPEQYGDLLRRNGWDGRTPIRLIGCDAGTNDFADRLSRHTGADVLAPTKPAWTDAGGRVYTSDADIGPDGNRHPRIPPNGEWQTHHPDGTRTPAGGDGYAPGTHNADKADHTDAGDARDRAAEGGPHERDPRFEHHPDDPPPDPRKPRELETLDPARCETENGLITHYDGQPIDEYQRAVLTDRAKLIQSRIEDRSLMPEDIRNEMNRNPEKWAGKNVVCVSVSVDHRTGKVYESINGAATDLIPDDDLNPVLRDRQEAMRGNPQPDGSRPGYTQPDRHPDRLGQPARDGSGNEIRTEWPQNDAPTRHAEVKNVNQMLNDRNLPPDITPEQLDEVLGELRVDNAFTPPGRGPNASGEFPDIAKCCPNCTRMIDGVRSGTERATHAVGDPERRIIPPEERHYAS